MTTLQRTDTGQYFDIPADFVVPTDIIAGLIDQTGAIEGGGTIEFTLPRNDRNKLILENVGYRTIPVQLVQGGFVTTGDLRILQRNDNNYNVQIDDQLSALLEALKSIPVSTLYWEDLNHAWTFANVVSARTSGWVYGLEDRGGMVYRNNDNTNLIATFFGGDVNNDIYNFYPSIFVFEYIQRMVQFAGFQLESSLLTNSGSWFRNVVIPFVGGNIQKADGLAAEKSASLRLANQISIPDGILRERPLIFDTSNNNTDYDDTTGEFTCSLSGMLTISYSVTFTSTGVNDFANVYIKKNGVILNYTPTYAIRFTGADTKTTNGEITISVLIGDVITFHYVSNANFIEPNSTASLVYADKLAYGETLEMRRFVPNMMCADLFASIIKTPCLVVDVDRARRIIKIEQFNDYYYPPNQPALPFDLQRVIDHDSITKTDLSEQGQNNYLNYAGDSTFGNGGFRIEDNRLEREAVVFDNVINATQMRATGFGGAVVLPSLFNLVNDGYPLQTSKSINNGQPLAFIVDKPQEIGLRMLFVSRVPFEDVDFFARTSVQIGTETVTDINYSYFFNTNSTIVTPLSLAFKDESAALIGSGLAPAQGLNLTEFAWSRYAADFQRYEQITVNAALTDGDMQLLDLRRIYPIDQLGGYYRILRIEQYTGNGFCTMVLRRAQSFDNSALLTVNAQTGKGTSNAGLSNPAGFNAPSPTPQISAVNRVQVGFASPTASRLALVASSGFDYGSAGDFGDFVTDDFITIPQSGNYTIMFQICTTAAEPTNAEIEIYYRVYDNRTSKTELFSRYASGHVASNDQASVNLINEESLSEGNVVEFFATITGSHTFTFDQEKSFATVVQSPINQLTV